MDFRIFREEVEFYDIPYMERSVDKINIMILEDALGNRQNFKDLLMNDINQCAWYLINNGFLRGTAFNKSEVCWSKITRKGEFLLENLKNQEFI